MLSLKFDKDWQWLWLSHLRDQYVQLMLWTVPVKKYKRVQYFSLSGNTKNGC